MSVVVGDPFSEGGKIILFFSWGSKQKQKLQRTNAAAANENCKIFPELKVYAESTSLH